MVSSVTETFRFEDQDDYMYGNEMFPILSSAGAWTSVIRDFKIQRRDGNDNVS